MNEVRHISNDEDLWDLCNLPEFDTIWDKIHQDQKLIMGRQYWNHTATWYGDVNYAYFNIKHQAQPLPKELHMMANYLEQRLDYPTNYFNCLLANAYTNKGIARHADDEDIFRQPDGTIGAVATISLGGSATVTITRNDRSEAPISFETKHGDCYLMPEGNFQDLYKHSVSPCLHPRISLTFRHSTKGGDHVN